MEWVDHLLTRLRGNGFQYVMSSPAARCRLPGILIARTMALPLRLDERLLELDFGAWESRRWDDVDRAVLDTWNAAPHEFTPPDGEPIPSLLARVRAVARDLLWGADAVVLSHGGPLRLLDRLLRGVPVDLGAAAPPLGSAMMIRTI